MAQLDDLMALAQNAYDRGEDTEAIRYLKDVLKLTTNSKDIASIYERIGTSFYHLQKNGEAIKSFSFALEHLSNLSEEEHRELDWSVNYKLGSALFSDGHYEKALAHNLKASEYIEHLCPEEVFMVLTAVGVNYEKMETFDKAIEFYLRALEVSDVPDEDRAMVLRFLGQCYDKKGEDRKAFKYYYKLFSIDPNYDDGWYLTYRFAQLSYRFRNYEDSKTYFHKVIPQIPSDESDYRQSSHQLLGYSYLAKKEFKRALNELKKALNVKADSSKRKAYIYCGIAQAYFGLNKVGKAIKFGLKALNEECDEIVEEKMYFLLAFCYGMRGIYKNKEKEGYYTEKLKSSFPNSAYLRELDKTCEGREAGRP